MKTLVIGLLGASLIGLAATATPAAAHPHGKRVVVVHRHHGPVCTIRTVVKRDYLGRKRVRTVRVCR